MTFFIDHCISKHFAASLRLFGEDVDDPITRYGDGSVKDKIWIPEVCREGRIIITADTAQTKYKGKTAIELSLLLKHRGRAFYLPKRFSEWRIWKQAACFFRCWETIVSMSADMKRGEFFDLSETGQPTQKHLRKPS